MKKINIEDGSEARGQRAVLISQQPQYLKGMDFNRNISFNGIFSAPYTLTANVDRNETELLIPVFNPLNFLSVPSGATHFRMINSFSVISDFVFNAATGAYEPADAELNEISNIAYSDYTPVDAVTPVIQITATLPNAPIMNANVTAIGCIGIEFYQQVGTNYYIFNAGNALKIHDLF